MNAPLERGLLGVKYHNYQDSQSGDTVATRAACLYRMNMQLFFCALPFSMLAGLPSVLLLSEF